jgi:predicted  nucleic acid-binding Zn-ribbon protein
MERALDERANEEAELTKRGGEYSIDAMLLAQADEIELLFGLTGNYASQLKDLPRVRGEFRGYGQDLANVARRLGIEDADTLSSVQPTDSLVARIKNLAQTGLQLESDLEEKDRTIEGIREELEKLEPDQVSEDSTVDIPVCCQTFEALRPPFGRLPELRRLELATSNLEQALAEATSQVSPAVSDLDALAVTSLPSSTAVEEFANRFEEHVASERSLRTQEKTASGKVATLKRQRASITTGNALGSPEQIAHASIHLKVYRKRSYPKG